MKEEREVEGKIIAKFTTVLFIIITMLFSNIVSIIAWAEKILIMMKL